MPPGAKFHRGAKPAPRHKLLSIDPFRITPALVTPTQFAWVPKQLAMWGNDQYGDCVSAEEAFAQAAYNVRFGGSELFVTDADVLAVILPIIG